MTLVRRYTLYLERLKTLGVRDPDNPFNSLGVNHPISIRAIRRAEINLAEAKGEIGLDEFRRRIEALDVRGCE